MVMATCRAILRNEETSADAFQATFLILLKSARSISKPGSLASWLHGVACRVSTRARAQSKSRHRFDAGESKVMESDLSGNAASVEIVALIHAEIERVPERFRRVLVLCGLEGETREQAAAQLGWTVGAVKGSLERARDLLEIRLRRRGVVLPAAAIAFTL